MKRSRFKSLLARALFVRTGAESTTKELLVQDGCFFGEICLLSSMNDSVLGLPAPEAALAN